MSLAGKSSNDAQSPVLPTLSLPASETKCQTPSSSQTNLVVDVDSGMLVILATWVI